MLVIEWQTIRDRVCTQMQYLTPLRTNMSWRSTERLIVQTIDSTVVLTQKAVCKYIFMNKRTQNTIILKDLTSMYRFDLHIDEHQNKQIFCLCLIFESNIFRSAVFKFNIEYNNQVKKHRLHFYMNICNIHATTNAKKPYSPPSIYLIPFQFINNYILTR